MLIKNRTTIIREKTIPHVTNGKKETKKLTFEIKYDNEALKIYSYPILFQVKEVNSPSYIFNSFINYSLN